MLSKKAIYDEGKVSVMECLSVISIVISIFALGVSVVSALHLYDNSQRNQAKRMYLSIAYEGSSEAGLKIHNCSTFMPIYNVRVYWLGTSVDDGKQNPEYIGSCEQILPGGTVKVPLALNSTTSYSLPDEYTKRIANSLADGYLFCNYAFSFNISQDKRWLVTTGGLRYRLSDVIHPISNIVRSIKKQEA